MTGDRKAKIKKKIRKSAFCTGVRFSERQREVNERERSNKTNYSVTVVLK